MEAPTDLFTGVVQFVAVAETESVRGAARQLGVTPSAISKAVAKLEASLEVRLLDRSARRVRLTSEGRAVFGQLREAVARGLAARDLALLARRRPQGLLRVSVPFVLGRHLIAPALPLLFERHPDLSVRLSLSDSFVRFSDGNADVAIRIGDPADSEAAMRRLGRTRWSTVAAPSYLARRGTPTTVSQLDAHECLRFVTPAGRARNWTFADRSGRTKTQRVRGSLVCDDGDVLVDAAIAGAGIVQAFDFMVADAIADGRLVELLPKTAAIGPRIVLLAAPGRISTPNVQAFLDFAQRLFAPA